MLSADRLKSGVPAVIKSVNVSCKTKRRLGSFGIIPGATVIFIRKAPFGDPIEFKVKDTRLAIRKCEAEKISVEYDRKNWTKRLFI